MGFHLLQLFVFSFLLSLLPFSQSFPRWLGEKSDSHLRLKSELSHSGFDPTRVTQLSWHPRAFLYTGFLSDAECDHLINLARDKLEKSMVADNNSGKSIMSEVRTSSGMFLKKAQDETVASIERRIAAWTFLPEENGESIQILHYQHGEKYEPHFDYFHDKANQELGGHRVATVLMYLSKVEMGGETIFPNSEVICYEVQESNLWIGDSNKGYCYAIKVEKSAVPTHIFPKRYQYVSSDIWDVLPSIGQYLHFLPNHIVLE